MAVPPELLAQARKAALMGDPMRPPPPEWDPEPPGVVVEEAAFAFARRSGRGANIVCQAILIGFVPGSVRRMGTRLSWTVRLSDPADTIDTFMDRLDALAPALASVGDRRWYNHARRISGRTKDKVPDHWIASCAVLPDSFDGDMHESEIAALITCSRDEACRVGREMATLRTGLVRMRRVEPHVGDVRAALLDALPPKTPEFIGTCLERNVGKHMEAPTAEQTARLLSIGPAYRAMAIASMADALANAFLARVETVPLGLYRMSVVLERARRGDLREVRRRVAAYLRGRILPGVSDWARLDDVYQWLAAESRMRAWAAEGSTPQALKTWLLEVKPDVPRDRTFVKGLERYHDRLREGATGRRRVRADPIADNFDLYLAEADASLADASAIEREAALAHAAAEAAGEVDHRFAVELPVRDAQFGDTGAKMLLNLRSVQVGEQLRRLLKSRGPELWGGQQGGSFLSDSQPGGSTFDATFHASRVVVYAGVSGLDATGGPAVPPAIIEPYRVGATLRPRYMGDDLLARRRVYLARTGMPSARLAPPNVLTGESRLHRALMRHSLDLRGEIVLPVVALLRGLSLGHLLYRSVCMLHVRVTTARQAIDDPVRGWTSIAGRAALVSIPKLPHELRLLPRKFKQRGFVADARTVRAFKDHAALTIRLDGGDPRDPKRMRVVPIDCCSPMPPECRADRYYFQAHGKLQDISQLRYCVSFLFRRKVLPHDPRHGGATVRFDEGESLQQVGKAIGTSPRRAKAYVTRGVRGRAAREPDAEAFLGRRDAIDGLGRPPRRPR